MAEKDGWLIDKNGNYWLTEADKRVPAECPICGAPVGLKFFGEPVFVCSTPRKNGNGEHYFGTLKFVEPEKKEEK